MSSPYSISLPTVAMSSRLIGSQTETLESFTAPYDLPGGMSLFHILFIIYPSAYANLANHDVRFLSLNVVEVFSMSVPI